MAPDPARPPETLQAWQRRITTLALAGASLMSLPALWAMTTRDGSLSLGLAYLGCYLLLPAAALLTRIHHHLRVGLYFLAGYAIAAIALVRLGLASNGRSLLVVLPLFGLLLIGRKGGLLAAGLSATIYGVMTVLAALGRLPPPVPQTTGMAWATHGLSFVMVFGPAAILLERTLAYQETALAREESLTAQLAAEATERRRLEVDVLQASERERQEVGRELDDGLGQQLAGALLQARVLDQELATEAGPEAEQLALLVEILDDALADLQGLSRGLTPAPLPDALGPALQTLAGRTRETVEVECAAEGDAPGLDPAEATELYRIAQEAVQNAVRHAGAGRITLTLTETPGPGGPGFELVVRDDGRGLPDPLVPGLGLRTMRARAESIGAALEVRPAPGGGTEVVCLRGEGARGVLRGGRRPGAA